MKKKVPGARDMSNTSWAFMGVAPHGVECTVVVRLGVVEDKETWTMIWSLGKHQKKFSTTKSHVDFGLWNDFMKRFTHCQPHRLDNGAQDAWYLYSFFFIFLLTIIYRLYTITRQPPSPAIAHNNHKAPPLFCFLYILLTFIYSQVEPSLPLPQPLHQQPQHARKRAWL